jgi:hypothetical protein
MMFGGFEIAVDHALLVSESHRFRDAQRTPSARVRFHASVAAVHGVDHGAGRVSPSTSFIVK